MPTYEYHCPRCKASYELRQGFDAETTHTCEECGKGTAKRVLHAPPVVFKGSGWYVTDYAKSGSAAAESKSKGESLSKGESTSKSETSTKSDSSSKSDSAPAKSDTPAPAASTSGKTKSD